MSYAAEVMAIPWDWLHWNMHGRLTATMCRRRAIEQISACTL